MYKVLRVVVIVSFVLGIFASVTGSAQGEDLDGRIKSLEQEVARIRSLDEELAILKERQAELKKEATAAAEALPTFSYRPGNGVMIEAADKSWSFRATIETHFRMLFESGRDQAGRTKGEIMLRRFRPGFFYCIDNCLWEIEATFDLDGFGTNSLFHRAAVHAHLEKLNPWLPTVDFGGDVSAASVPPAKGRVP